MILTVSAVRNSPTQITVSWTTDKPTIGMAAAGAPGNFALGVYSLFSALENSFGTTHSATVRVLSGVTPVHYTVVVEDQHGNFSHAIDQTVGSSSPPAPPPAPPPPPGGGGLSPDGSSITGGTGSLVTGYGTWTFGPEFAPAPAYGGPPFYAILLNGKRVWGYGDVIWGAQRMTVANGGNLYVFTFDQQWWSWTDYFWLFNDSPNLNPMPIDPLPTTFAPPYTPSPDGTSISGGVGSVTTDDGVWSFGAAETGGWVPMLNGVPAAIGKKATTEIQVNAHGQAFLHIVNDGGFWATWEGSTYQPSSGPTSGPIPIDVTFSPSLGLPPHDSPVGTLLTTILVTMSDGSTFSGTLSLSGSGDAALSPSSSVGPNLVTTQSPFPWGGQLFYVTATQNGCTYTGIFDTNAT